MFKDENREYITLYCRHCEKETLHEYLGKDQSTTQRTALFFLTMGFNEMLVSDVGKCTECGTINKEEYN